MVVMRGEIVVDRATAGADEIDGKADGGHRNRLAKIDRTGWISRTRLSQAICNATSARMMALEKAARSPNLPVPKAKRELPAWRRAKR